MSSELDRSEAGGGGGAATPSEYIMSLSLIKLIVGGGCGEPEAVVGYHRRNRWSRSLYYLLTVEGENDKISTNE